MSDYEIPDKIDFSILTMRWKDLTLFSDDLFLGMQGMNIGPTDSTITDWEYDLLREYIQTERTPFESCLMVSAFSQMWIFSVYEVLRLWRDRLYKYKKWHESGGINQMISNLDGDEDINVSKNARKRQLQQYAKEASYRLKCDKEWTIFESSFLAVELLRMNLAKHSAPGRDNLIPRAPGYGRINMQCGAMDFEVIDRSRGYSFLSRRDIADSLRAAFESLDQGAKTKAKKWLKKSK
jgi:hypothetical protein